MPGTMLVHVGVLETGVAVLRDGALERYWRELREDAEETPRVGDVILGRVQRVLPAMEAAFVDIGGARSGFLAARDARGRGAEGGRLREGETVLVQVAKEPLAGKGARLVTQLSLAGRHLVLVAPGAGISVSRRIEDEKERARLARLMDEVLAASDEARVPETGYILRTAAVGAEREALTQDAVRLARRWRALSAAREKAQPPALLNREPGLVERVLRDETAEVDRIVIDDAETAESARRYAESVAPELLSRIERYEGSEALFEAHGVEDAIGALDSSRVTLPSGGWITIEETEALTAIDVNSGRYIDAGSLEEASLTVDLEAADALARQLALRGIGGIVVVDFIRLSDERNFARLLASLREALARDRAPAEVSALAEFGLVAITRKRERDPLARRFSEACACCAGRGRHKTAAGVGLDILRRAERAASAAPGKKLVGFAAPEVAAWLELRGAAIAAALARRGAARWRVVSERERTRESFSVETES